MSFLKVGSGAALGALARFLLTVACGAGAWPLFGINLLGSALMGWFKPGLFWGTGVLGGFTSFSAFAVLSVQASPTFAATYVVAHLIGCVGAFLLADAASRHRRTGSVGSLS